MRRKADDVRILRYIRDYMLEHGWSPSLRELGADVGLKSLSSIHRRLLSLDEQGLVQYRGVRQLRVTAEGLRKLDRAPGGVLHLVAGHSLASSSARGIHLSSGCCGTLTASSNCEVE